MLKMYHQTVQPTPTTNELRLLAPIPRILVVDADPTHCREARLGGSGKLDALSHVVCNVVAKAATPPRP